MTRGCQALRLDSIEVHHAEASGDRTQDLRHKISGLARMNISIMATVLDPEIILVLAEILAQATISGRQPTSVQVRRLPEVLDFALEAGEVSALLGRTLIPRECRVLILPDLMVSPEAPEAAEEGSVLAVAAAAITEQTTLSRTMNRREVGLNLIPNLEISAEASARTLGVLIEVREIEVAVVAGVQVPLEGAAMLTSSDPLADLDLLWNLSLKLTSDLEGKLGSKQWRWESKPT